MDYFPLIRDALRYIEENMDRHVQVQELAGRCHMSRFYFQRLFKAATGMNVRDYIDARTMSEAAKQLLRTDSRILDIALAFGYESHEAFSRKFKQTFGCCPDHARKGRLSLPLQEPVRAVEREFVHKHKALMVPFSLERGEAFTIFGRSRVFDPDDEGETAALTDMVTELARQYGEPHRIRQLFNLSLPEGEDGRRLRYFSGFLPAEGRPLPDELERSTVPPGDYAVFQYKDDLGGKHRTVVRDMFRSVLLSGLQLRGGGFPLYFYERYGGAYKETRRFSVCLPVAAGTQVGTNGQAGSRLDLLR